MASLLHELLTHAARQFPDKACLVHGSRILTYSECEDQVRQLARLLIQAGLEPGDRVAVHLEKSIQEVIGILAVSLAGGVSVNVNALLKARQLKHIVDDSGACVLLTSYSRLRTIGATLDQMRGLHTVIASGNTPAPRASTLRIIDCATARNAPFANDVRRIDSDIAAIIYTSGSTGLPKGVVLSHRNLVSGAESVSHYLNNTPDDRILSILPFSFDYGLNQLTTSLHVGATLVLKNYLAPGEVLASIEADRITGLAGVPTFWSQLLQVDWSNRYLDGLRYITNSGGRFAEEHVREYRRRLPETNIYLMYGLTEAFRSTYLEPDQIDVRPTSMGKAIPNAEILVLNESSVPCAPGEIGELVHRGVHVGLGYWADPALTAERFRPNPVQPAGLPTQERVVFSGDLVRMDEEGYLYFVGRRDQMIKTSGFRVSPTEVEEYFYNTGLVRDAVAHGMPDAVLGERIRVILALREGVHVTGEELLRMVSKQMPSFMIPKDIEIRNGLPKTASGKLDRQLVSTTIPD